MDARWKQIPVFQIGNRQDIQPWQTDPRKVLLKRHKVGLVMVPPVDLDDFLSPDQVESCPTHFVHGLKGSGKTSLLLAKRALLDGEVAARKLLCVPSGFPYVFSPFMDATTISFSSWEALGFHTKEAWKYAWLILLGAYLLNSVDRDSEHLDPPAPPVLSDNLIRILGASASDSKLDERRWVACFKHLIETTRGNAEDTLRRIYETEVRSRLKSVVDRFQRPIFIFVDGIDETFYGPGGSPLLKLAKDREMQRHLPQDERGTGLDPNILAREIWVNAQTSLLAVSTEFLVEFDGWINLIGSMRSEAYLETTQQGAQGVGQRSDIVQAITYTHDHLEAIFRANLRATMKVHSYDKPSRDDEIVRFFGVSELRNSVTGIDESIFQYVRRHTFEEPRDLMLIGGRLSHLPEDARGEFQEISEIVIASTSVILYDYFKFMDEEWDHDFENIVLQHIPRNIFTDSDARELKQRFSQSENINARDPLTYLYRRGLIGVVSENLIQRFHNQVRVNGADKLSAPKSSMYLTHPALDPLIARSREVAGLEKFQNTTGIAIGNRIPWIAGMRLKRIQLHLDGMAVRLTIDGMDVSEPGRERALQTFHTLSDIPTALFVACLRQMVKLSLDEPLISSVVAQIKEMVAAGVVTKTQQRKGRTIETVEYIEDLLLDPERQPAPFETIRNRLKEYNIDNVNPHRSMKTRRMGFHGINWKDIHLISFEK
ncbi:hypothetical protein [Paraburkholderia sp. DHOC27]|uniref:hypothetical protein n=1 Tax=Paraburkholderia sp. DHOC27 TaxID=2303330 RepID=UPI000E3C74DA|nr:hypothetical protein [Paraburkholderia sp. DHOC27]RFU47587.1 hypothetical protein D0B32_08415 [Paraburkholderia sp. DHOC27]